MKYSDFDLVRGITSGDKRALDLLIHRWYPRIYGYVFKLIGHEQDSYDVTQDKSVVLKRTNIAKGQLDGTFIFDIDDPDLSRNFSNITQEFLKRVEGENSGER